MHKSTVSRTDGWSWRCTAQTRSGNFCDAPSLPDAPFPICAKHAREAFQFGAQLVSVAVPSTGPWASVPVREVLHGYVELTRRMESRPIDITADLRSCVYFVQVGDVIKIGASGNVKSRMASYPPHRKLLYVHYCPDAWDLEKELHHRFREHLHSGKEWFKPAPEILALIKQMKRETSTGRSSARHSDRSR